MTRSVRMLFTLAAFTFAAGCTGEAPVAEEDPVAYGKADLPGAPQPAPLPPTPPPGSVILNITNYGGGTVYGPGFSCATNCTQFVPQGTAIVLTQTPEANTRFRLWGGDCRGTGACTLTMAADRTVELHFDTQFTIIPQPHVIVFTDLLYSPGHDRLTCGRGATDCSQFFYDTDSVRYQAQAESGYHLIGWGGDCVGADLYFCLVNMTHPRTIWAEAAPGAPIQHLDVQVTGGGSVIGGPIDCGLVGSTCSDDSAFGAVVTLKAQGTRFLGWSGDCHGFNRTCTVTMDQAHSVTARFAFNGQPW